MSDVLTITDACNIAEVLSAAQHSRTVARLTDGVVFTGTARSIGDMYGNFAANSDDIRDCYLRVTLSSGFEAFWPVRELMSETQAGEFVADYR